jgi:hypothetical protein
MAHYAFLDENNVVTEVIVGNNESLDIDWEIYYSNIQNKVCKRTSFNTIKGIHINGGTPYRKNYAGVGYIFREDVNSPEGAFVPPYPGEGYILDENTCLWVEASAL